MFFFFLEKMDKKMRQIVRICTFSFLVCLFFFCNKTGIFRLVTVNLNIIFYDIVRMFTISIEFESR